jgi:uncharacterized protein (DUF2141 family)
MSRRFPAVAAFLLFLFSVPAFAQLVVAQHTAADLASTIAGQGVTISNVTLQGNAAQAGTFSGGLSAGIGIDRGVILSTGDIASAVGPNVSDSTSTDWSGAGDSQLDAIVAPFTTNDAAVLQFDFVPSASVFTVRYVFASEEYLEFVNSEFNDVFAFYLNASNVALLPGTSTAITVNSVNDSTNSAYYRDNGLPSYNIEFDGFTVVLTATAKVNPGQQYHFKFAIADTSDGILDAAVFIEAGSFEANQQAELHGDFNGDGKDDILLRDGAGNIGMWLMNGNTILSGSFVGSPGAYTIAGIGDFDGDGKADILLRDALGNLGMWIMNGSTIVSGHFVGSPGAYTVAGVADFNGDGKADILLRDGAGSVGMWIMNGSTITSGALVGATGGSSVAGVADFNADSKADILLRDSGGNLGLWTMNGATVTAGAFVGSPGAYTVAGVNDFTGDNKADILLRDSLGTIGMWVMNGSTLVSGHLVGSPGAGYAVNSVGDYNGDNHADVLIRHAASGDVGMWIMNGPTITSGSFVSALSPSYQIY